MRRALARLRFLLVHAPAWAVVLACLCGSASGQCQYSVTFIEAPFDCGFGIAPTIRVNALNNSGLVVGTHECFFSDYETGFVWSETGGMVDLVPPGEWSALSIVPWNINDSGVIVGYALLDGLAGARGFIHDLVAGDWTLLPTVDEPIGQCFATDVNNAGVVVGGRSIGSELNPTQAFVWEDGVFNDLGVMSQGTSRANGINDAGVVVGSTGGFGNKLGFVFGEDILTILPPIPAVGGLTSLAVTVNEVGEILVDGLIANEKGQIIGWNGSVLVNDEYTLIEPPESSDSIAPQSMNNLGSVTGLFRDSTSTNVGFVWAVGEQHPLVDLLDSSGDVIALLKEGHDINDNGQILAEGQTFEDGGAEFLLTPVAPSAADINGDCVTDRDDLIKLLGHWGMTASPADLVENGVVDVHDLLYMLANWG